MSIRQISNELFTPELINEPLPESLKASGGLGFRMYLASMGKSIDEKAIRNVIYQYITDIEKSNGIYIWKNRNDKTIDPFNEKPYFIVKDKVIVNAGKYQRLYTLLASWLNTTLHYIRDINQTEMANKTNQAKGYYASHVIDNGSIELKPLSHIAQLEQYQSYFDDGIEIANILNEICSRITIYAKNNQFVVLRNNFIVYPMIVIYDYLTSNLGSVNSKLSVKLNELALYNSIYLDRVYPVIYTSSAYKRSGNGLYVPKDANDGVEANSMELFYLKQVKRLLNL